MAETRQVRWSFTAHEDLQLSLDFILTQWNAAVAAKFLQAVDAKIELLRRAPFIGSPSAYLPDCRKTLVAPYHAMIYRVIDDEIEIVRLFDLRQDPSKLR
jgi:plasmid stabilization system protein ParE